MDYTQGSASSYADAANQPETSENRFRPLNEDDQPHTTAPHESVDWPRPERSSSVCAHCFRCHNDECPDDCPFCGGSNDVVIESRERAGDEAQAPVLTQPHHLAAHNVTGGDIHRFRRIPYGETYCVVGGNVFSFAGAPQGSTFEITSSNIYSFQGMPQRATFNITGSSIFSFHGMLSGTTLNVVGGVFYADEELPNTVVRNITGSTLFAPGRTSLVGAVVPGVLQAGMQNEIQGFQHSAQGVQDGTDGVQNEAQALEMPSISQSIYPQQQDRATTPQSHNPQKRKYVWTKGPNSRAGDKKRVRRSNANPSEQNRSATPEGVATAVSSPGLFVRQDERPGFQGIESHDLMARGDPDGEGEDEFGGMEIDE